MSVIETMVQPNGSYVRIELTNINFLADLRINDENAKESYEAKIYVYWPYGSYHSPYHMSKRMYGDERGLYTYKKQKEPIYFWKPQNVEEDYEHWQKGKGGYYLPLNEPRKLKKNYF